MSYKVIIVSIILKSQKALKENITTGHFSSKNIMKSRTSIRMEKQAQDPPEPRKEGAVSVYRFNIYINQLNARVKPRPPYRRTL